ncbi:hypothetical protein EUA93_10380 [Nocardioides oleivorans]|uniref:Uncharacterized protein n=1 Tax=Nocardioides oleivorans TaxID=273676 RepID=A0A4Q2S2U9_9ACTN|nr:hypothetical protein [Nocardioides oleivorans]RYB94714.1 hypothetical protein EUA93_10380 [Nocardioides oleivorans]
MDLSALIFVALAVAWAVYLIPKALKHHDEVVRSRSVDKFSHTMRVLARREPVDRRNARLVVSPIRAALRPPVETKKHVEPEPVMASARPASRPVTRPAARPADLRASARRAAKRRRNVLALVLLVNVVVVGLASFSVITWPWVAGPVALLVAWLVACRVSVRAERAGRSAIEVGAPPRVDEAPDQDDLDLTGEIPVTPGSPRIPVETPVVDSPVVEAPVEQPVAKPVAEPVAGGWDMVPTTLPTYVSKPAASRRTVSTIDLDSTGVWSSGRNDEDSAIARSAEKSAKAARASDESRRASGA